MGLFDGIVGAVKGLVTGGPVGAVAGGISGLASNGGDKAQAESSQLGDALSGKTLTAQITTAEGKTIKVEGSSESLASIFSALA